jgi:hypothetical protein
MDQELKKFAKNEESFSEMKEYMMDHFCSLDSYSIPPEEGIAALHPGAYSNAEIYKTFLTAQDEFYHQFWCEHLAPEMTPEAMERFFETFKGDLGEKFFSGLKKYLNKHYPKVEDNVE